MLYFSNCSPIRGIVALFHLFWPLREGKLIFFKYLRLVHIMNENYYSIHTKQTNSSTL